MNHCTATRFEPKPGADVQARCNDWFDFTAAIPKPPITTEEKMRYETCERCQGGSVLAENRDINKKEFWFHVSVIGRRKRRTERRARY